MALLCFGRFNAIFGRPRTPKFTAATPARNSSCSDAKSNYANPGNDKNHYLSY
jgi:hypothetical protein